MRKTKARLVIVIVITIISGILIWFQLEHLRLSEETISIHLNIYNQTDEKLGPFTLSDIYDPHPMDIEEIAPHSFATISYKRFHHMGEDVITLVDKYGNSYNIVPYFEQGVRGRVDIRVNCVSPDGISGKIRELNNWYYSMEWKDWGEQSCNLYEK